MSGTRAGVSATDAFSHYVVYYAMRLPYFPAKASTILMLAISSGIDPLWAPAGLSAEETHSIVSCLVHRMNSCAWAMKLCREVLAIHFGRIGVSNIDEAIEEAIKCARDTKPAQSSNEERI